MFALEENGFIMTFSEGCIELYQLLPCQFFHLRMYIRAAAI
jgi:hypothetical protein